MLKQHKEVLSIVEWVQKVKSFKLNCFWMVLEYLSTCLGSSGKIVIYQMPLSRAKKQTEATRGFNRVFLVALSLLSFVGVLKVKP